MSRRLDDDERISDWIDGRLNARQLDRLDAEFRVDPEFRAAAERLRDQVLAMRAAFGGDDAVDARDAGPPPDLAERVLTGVAVPPAPRAGGFRVPAWVWSAAAAALLVGGVLVVRSLGERQPRSEDVSRAPDAPVRGAPADAAPQPPAAKRADDGIGASTPQERSEPEQGAAEDRVAAPKAGAPDGGPKAALPTVGSRAGGLPPPGGRARDRAEVAAEETAAESGVGTGSGALRSEGADPAVRLADYVYVVELPPAAYAAFATSASEPDRARRAPAGRGGPATPGPAGPATVGPGGPATVGPGGAGPAVEAPGRGPSPKGGEPAGPGVPMPRGGGAGGAGLGGAYGVPAVDLPSAAVAAPEGVAPARATPAAARALDLGGPLAIDGGVAYRHRDGDLAWRLEGEVAAVALRLRGLRAWAEARGAAVVVQRVAITGDAARAIPPPADAAREPGTAADAPSPPLGGDEVRRIVLGRESAIAVPLDHPWVVVRARRD